MPLHLGAVFGEILGADGKPFAAQTDVPAEPQPSRILYSRTKLDVYMPQ